MYVRLLVLLLVGATRLYAAPAQEKYDQRQTGDVNVQLDLRNIEVLAILGDYEMYEDYEDYPEVHVPPDVSGSLPPTEGENVTNSVGAEQNGTISSDSNTNGTTATNEAATTSSQVPQTGQPNTPVLKMPSNKRRCSQGFFRDRRRRCRKENAVLNLPFGLRQVPRVRPTE